MALALACAACAGPPQAAPTVAPARTQRGPVRVLFLTARLAGEQPPLRVTFAVDSVPRYDTGAPIGSWVGRVRGASFSGQLEADGTIRALSGGDSTVRLLAELAQELPHFFPRIPPGGVAAGARWSDTTETTSRTGGLPLKLVAVSEHEATAPADTGQTGALTIHTRTTYTFSGEGTQGGQAYSVRGEGRRYAVELLDLTGQYLGLTAADTSTFSISMPALDVSIPGRQTRADTVSRVP